MYRLYDFDFCFRMESETFKRKTFSGIAVNIQSKAKYWIRDGLVHRDEILGPAIEYEYGSKVWCSNGERHRINGPAAEFKNGVTSWYIQGTMCTESQHKLLVSIMRLKGLLT